MSDRVPAGIAGFSSMVILIYACSTGPTPEPVPVEAQERAGTPQTGITGAQARVPLTDSARRVRDSTTAARRDSGEAMLLRRIAGRENLPAESVFRNIKVMKGVPAGRLVRIMNAGFGRSLGVSCGYCHVPPNWELDDKEEKNTARLMWTMTAAINRDYISKVPNDSGPAPVVNCMTCHQGMPRPPSSNAPRPSD
jgi:hypothetical protein